MNQARSAVLESHLVSLGYSYLPVSGRYAGRDEQTFLVFGIYYQDAVDLGISFMQEGVLTDAGFVLCPTQDRFPVASMVTTDQPSEYVRNLPYACSTIHCQDGDLFMVCEV
jgi:hypothetical protein